MRKIRDARDNTVSVSDDDFAENVKKMFGRDVVLERPEGAERTTQTTSLGQIKQNMFDREEKTENKMLKPDFWEALE